MASMVVSPAAAKNHENGLSHLTFCCSKQNDLFQAIQTDGSPRYDTPDESIENARDNSGVLLLADGYPAAGPRLTEALLAQAKAKKLRLYVEYPEAYPGLRFDEPRTAVWERIVVTAAKDELGLPPLHLLSAHSCRFRPTVAADPLLVIGRVAGMDRAVYGLPKENFPILFRAAEGVLVATTKLSGFNTARYAPVTDWPTLWKHILAEVDPVGAPHDFAVEPITEPAYLQQEKLPLNAEQQAVAKAAAWVTKSRLLVSAQRRPEVRTALESGREEIVVPPAEAPIGDGSYGILEGYASHIDSDGGQTQRAPLRADCQAETAALLAMHAALSGDAHSRSVATNLLNFTYVTSGMHRGKRGDPRHPAFGLIAWGDIAPAWKAGNYGDDNARTILATLAAASCLKSNDWDAAVLKALLANLRTTGRLGFRGDRIDVPLLERHGWRHFHDSEAVSYSPHFEAYLWACYLWAFARTGEQAFFDKAESGIRMTMAFYPDGWRWGDNLERAHMLLPLAWLVRVKDTPEHREWLTRVARDILQHQQPCGAIADCRSRVASGHYSIPATNEEYGTNETPLIQADGDPISDQLYTTGFALLGLHEAVAATGDQEWLAAENRLAEYLVRIQVRSEKIPYLDGAWFRAFNFGRWEYWASSADMGWGAWCVESGWAPAWTAVTLGLRCKQESLWDLTADSAIDKQLPGVRKLMSENDGGPWQK